MLKRYQVLLEEWLADFIKARAAGHDSSFSEVIRVALCIYYGSMISEMYPDYKFKYNTEKMVPLMKKFVEANMPNESVNKTISELYYETRKAMEYFTEKQAKGAQPVSK